MTMRISGAGCCLMDLLYPNADFSSAAFSAAASRREGDGGLAPGRLVFAEDAERFTGRPFAQTLAAITGSDPAARAKPAAGAKPAAENVGGPSVVSLVHAAQMLEGEDALVSYYGATGDDEVGRRLRRMLSLSPLDLSRFESRRGRTPSTYVLSDPGWDSGRGERCFVNEIGAAEAYGPEDLSDAFYEADIVALGGTALVPRLHGALPGILERIKGGGALSLVNTVFDFRAERRDAIGAWRLGGPAVGSSLAIHGPGPAEAYRACDLLVMDRDEALRLSGERELPAALHFFESSGVGAFVVTRGGDGVLAWAGAGRFSPFSLRELPVSDRSKRERSLGRAGGDTTGCGDAFAGGLMAALALQLKSAAERGAKKTKLDLGDALSWGIAAGAFTLGILGGTYYESRPGEKRGLVSSYRDDWLAQAGSP